MTQDVSSFSTAGLPPPDRAAAWTRTISEAYFSLDLDFQRPDAFQGVLTRTTLGDIGLSRLRSAPAAYRRRRRHLSGAQEEQYLVTLPRASPVEFSQLGRHVRCAPGGIVLERGDEPYRFQYERPNDLFVLKVPRSALTERIRAPDRFCAAPIDGASGPGALLAASIAAVPKARVGLDAHAADTVGRHLLELLALTLAGESGAMMSDDEPVREAHRRRARDFIERNIQSRKLSPHTVAEGCGVSTRYLHKVFQGEDITVAGLIRELRLMAAKRLLTAGGATSLAELAYRCGFADQAQFSRQFKSRFDQTPSEYRRRRSG